MIGSGMPRSAIASNSPRVRRGVEQLVGDRLHARPQLRDHARREGLVHERRAAARDRGRPSPASCRARCARSPRTAPPDRAASWCSMWARELLRGAVRIAQHGDAVAVARHDPGAAAVGHRPRIDRPLGAQARPDAGAGRPGTRARRDPSSRSGSAVTVDLLGVVRSPALGATAAPSAAIAPRRRRARAARSRERCTDARSLRESTSRRRPGSPRSGSSRAASRSACRRPSA